VPTETPKQPSGGLRILLVEDEIMVALLAVEMLTALGHEVVGPVGRLDKALILAGRERLDLAVLDISIIGGEVYQVADALAARGIPFFFCTAYGRSGLKPPYRDCPRLQKPYSPGDLRAAISAACR
jgi:CheY-like chemotaxis protein